MATTAKMSDQSHILLKQISEKTGKPMQLVLDEAVELYRREKFFEELNREVLATKSDSKLWREELEERALFEGTLSDGLIEDSGDRK